MSRNRRLQAAAAQEVQRESFAVKDLLLQDLRLLVTCTFAEVNKLKVPLNEGFAAFQRRYEGSEETFRWPTAAAVGDGEPLLLDLFMNALVVPAGVSSVHVMCSTRRIVCRAATAAPTLPEPRPVRHVACEHAAPVACLGELGAQLGERAGAAHRQRALARVAHRDGRAGQAGGARWCGGRGSACTAPRILTSRVEEAS